MLVIHDDNYQEIITQGSALGHATGYIPGTAKLKASFSDTYTTIPRSQWAALVKQGAGTFLSDLIKAAKIPSKNQDGLNYCWAYASTATVEVERCIQGQPYIDLSPESVGGPIMNWRNVGGNGIDALDQLTKVGACASSFMDSANSLHPSRWKTGWEADCGNHKVTISWANVSSFDEVFTCLLYRMPVSIGLAWWGHQVLLTDPVVFDDGSFGVVMRNSWGEDWPNQGDGGWSTLTERKSQPDGSFASVATTVMDAPEFRSDHKYLLGERERLIRGKISRLRYA